MRDYLARPSHLVALQGRNAMEKRYVLNVQVSYCNKGHDADRCCDPSRLSVGAAAAQGYPRDVVAHCARITSQMRELGCMTCDGYRDRMRLACEANGGRIPGSRALFGTELFDTGPTGTDRRAQ